MKLVKYQGCQNCEMVDSEELCQIILYIPNMSSCISLFFACLAVCTVLQKHVKYQDQKHFKWQVSLK